MIEQKDSTKSGLKLVFEANKENKFPLIIGTPQLAFLSSTLAYSPTDISSKDKTVYVKCMWRSVWFVGETSVYGGRLVTRISISMVPSTELLWPHYKAVLNGMHLKRLWFHTYMSSSSHFWLTNWVMK